MNQKIQYVLLKLSVSNIFRVLGVKTFGFTLQWHIQAKMSHFILCISDERRDRYMLFGGSVKNWILDT